MSCHWHGLRSLPAAQQHGTQCAIAQGHVELANVRPDQRLVVRSAAVTAVVGGVVGKSNVHGDAQGLTDEGVHLLGRVAEVLLGGLFLEERLAGLIVLAAQDAADRLLPLQGDGAQIAGAAVVADQGQEAAHRGGGGDLGALRRIHGRVVGPVAHELLPEFAVDEVGGRGAAQLGGGGLDLAVCLEDEGDVEGAEVEGLAERKQVGSGHERQNLNRITSVASGDEGQRVQTLVVHLGRLNVVADGVVKVGQLGHVRGHVDVHTLEGVRQTGVVSSQVGRQALARGRVDEFRALREDHLSEHLHRGHGLLHGGRDGGGLEVTTVVEHGAVRVDQGVVSGRVQLDFHLGQGQSHVLDLRAHPLRRCTEGVAVLSQGVVVLGRANLARRSLGDELGVGKEFKHVLSSFLLARVGTCLGNEGVIVAAVPDKGFSAHGREDLGKQKQLVGLVEHNTGSATAECSSVHNTQSLLGSQFERRQTGLSQSLVSANDTIPLLLATVH